MLWTSRLALLIFEERASGYRKGQAFGDIPLYQLVVMSLGKGSIRSKRGKEGKPARNNLDFILARERTYQVAIVVVGVILALAVVVKGGDFTLLFSFTDWIETHPKTSGLTVCAATAILGKTYWLKIFAGIFNKGSA